MLDLTFEARFVYWSCRRKQEWVLEQLGGGGGSNKALRRSSFEKALMLTIAVVLELLSHIQLFVTPWTIACQASLSSRVFQRLLKFMPTESAMPSNHMMSSDVNYSFTVLCSRIIDQYLRRVHLHGVQKCGNINCVGFDCTFLLISITPLSCLTSYWLNQWWG